MKTRFLVAFSLIALALLTLFLRQPVFGNIQCNPDVAATAYASRNLERGGVIYDKCIETKPPGAYIVYAVMFSVFGEDMRGVYGASFLFHFLTALFLFLLGRRMHSIGAGLAAAYLYTFHSVSFGCSGLCPNFETWTMLPVSAGFYFLWRGQNGRSGYIILAGVCGATAVLFKQTAIFFPLAAIPLLYLDRKGLPDRRARIVETGTDLIYALIGAAIPAVAVLGFFAARDGLSPLFQALAPGATAGYAGSTSISFIKEGIAASVPYLLWHSITLITLASAIFWAPLFIADDSEKPRHERARRVIITWLVAAILSVVAGTKFYDHYFIVLMPPLALAAGYSAIRLAVDASSRRILTALIAAFVVLSAPVDMALELKVAWKALQERTTDQGLDYRTMDDLHWSKAELVRTWRWSLEMERVGNCIAKHTQPNDRIFVWDYIPGVYWYANRTSPTRHYMYFEVAINLPRGHGAWHTREDFVVQKNREEMMSDFAADPPQYIVAFSREFDPDNPSDFILTIAPMFTGLRDFTDQYYAPDPACSTKHIKVYKSKPNIAELQKTPGQ